MEEGEAPEEEGSKQPSAAGFPARFLTPKWLLIILVVSVAAHAIGLAYFRLTANRPAHEPSPEVSLGVFRYVADPAQAGQITSAEFSLHIALLDQVEGAARRALSVKRYRVQQAVEELTRRARSGDFDDPLLTGLKRQLQEQINQTLGFRVIADVIITDLKLERKADEIGRITETADILPWTEKPPG